MATNTSLTATPPSGNWPQQQAALRALGARNAQQTAPAPALKPLLGSYQGTPISANSDVQAQVDAINKAHNATLNSLKEAGTPTATNPIQKSPAPAPTPQPTAGNSYTGLLGTVAQAGSPAAVGYTGDISTYGAGNIPIGQRAADIASQYGRQIADVGGQGARFRAGQITTGTSPVAEGNAAVTAQTTAAEQQALAQGESAALQGTAQQLTAQQQAANAANEAAGQAYTGQGLIQSGLGTAAGYAQPAPAAYGQTVFNPLTGEYSGGSSNLNPQDQAKTLASQVMNGQITYDQALSSLGYAGSIGPTLLNNEITAAGGNPLSLQATGAGQQSILQSLPALQSANTAAKGIEQTITSFLQQNPQINSSTATIANAAQQWIEGKQLGDPAYQQFFNYLSEYANTLAPVLGVGGDPTNLKTQIAQGFLNAQASGQSVSQVLQAMGQLADQKIQNIQSGATGGGVVASGTQNESSNPPGWF